MADEVLPEDVAWMASLMRGDDIVLRIHFYDNRTDRYYVTHHTGKDCDWDDTLTLGEILDYTRYGYTT